MKSKPVIPIPGKPKLQPSVAQDMAKDKRMGIVEGSKKDLARDVMMSKLKNARGMK